MHCNIPTFSETVSPGHPDKFCDCLADAILDEALRLNEYDANTRCAIEMAVAENRITLEGEVRYPLGEAGAPNVQAIAQRLWAERRYGGTPMVVNNLRAQSAEIAAQVDADSDAETGAGDQTNVVGFYTNATPEGLPVAHAWCQRLAKKHWQLFAEHADILRADAKFKVQCDAAGTPTDITVSAQHSENISLPNLREWLRENLLLPVLGEAILAEVKNIRLNAAGTFHSGGPEADAGVVGRKLVVDAYGPTVPVGGGAFSGKDGTKVDRSAAYWARWLAKQAVEQGLGNAVTVWVSFDIGHAAPSGLVAINEIGEDVSKHLQKQFGSATVASIMAQFDLMNPNGWTFEQTAQLGHFGHGIFLWEKMKNS